jgi:ribosomal protein S18 acetylase RimI-like enzyme
VTVTYEWRGDFDNTDLNALHAAGFRESLETDWHTKVHRHSLGWVCARQGGELAGFVNVAWDGGAHAFILDTVVAAESRRRGIGTGLISAATEGAKAARCTWLHVDFEGLVAPFYLEAVGFTSTSAGLIGLADT